MLKRLFLFSLLLPFTLSSQPLLLGDSIRFLALGDSYTIGQSVGANERWPAQLSDSLASRNVFTDTLSYIATTGWRTDDLVNAITNQNLQHKNYNLVSLLIGVNNQYQGRPFSQYVTEFPALLDSAIRYAGGNKTHVFVVSIPDYAYTPFGQQSANPAQISSELDQYNVYNKRMADSMQVRYFDITPISRQGTTTPTYVAGDGMHPSGEQYAQWVKLMLDFIDSQVIVSGIASSTKANNIIVSPNPASDEVFISIQKNAQQLNSVDIYNSTGQLVNTGLIAEGKGTISLKALADGLYTVRINTGSGYTVKKIIKMGNAD